MSTTETAAAPAAPVKLPTKLPPGVDYIDQRTGIAKVLKAGLRKVFPDHWSFLLGEIALYSFVVLLLTGTFLAVYFVPSMGTTTYTGPYVPLQGMEVSQAFDSTMHISFEVRGGLLIRQIHHWAALIFMASIVLHMLRIFFTGAFRKPRELNWMVGFLLMILGLAAGFTGYSLPDDVLSGNGLRITDGVLRAVPIVGSYGSYLLFGGEFPGEAIIPRLFTAHILIVPGLILALVGLHLFLVVLHKHTQYPGPGKTNKNVVGYPLFPVYVAKAGGFFFVVFGVIALMAATLTINPIWNYGPYDPSPVSAGAQPDWYMLFLEGALRLMPGQPEYVIGGYTLSLNVLIPAMVIPGILFTGLAIYPFLEAWVTGDKREHHILDRPRNKPVRTALGAAFLSAFLVLVLAGSNDIIATHFKLSINDITNVFRVALFVLPVVSFWVTKRICLGLQRRDREIALHGRATGRIVRFASGEYIEVHQPLSARDRWLMLPEDPHKPLEIAPREDARGVRRKGYRKDRMRQRLSNFFYRDYLEPLTPRELVAAQDHHEAYGKDVATTEGRSSDD